MLIIGSHVSYKNDTQLIGSVNEALSYGSNAFMFYTGAPQNTQRGAINDLKTFEALNIMKENDIALEHVICHAPYIVNLGNKTDPDKYAFSKEFIKKELKRCDEMGITKMVIHPGNAIAITKEEGLDNIANAIHNCNGESDVLIKNITYPYQR